MSPRLDIDTWAMALARATAARSTCPRAPRGVGCVVLGADKRVVSTGYVGSLPGAPHCDEVGCLIDAVTGGCSRTLHAEQNAVLFAERARLAGATAYVTLSPCVPCFKLLAGAGVRRVLYVEEYRLGVATQRELGAHVDLELRPFEATDPRLDACREIDALRGILADEVHRLRERGLRSAADALQADLDAVPRSAP